MFFKELEFQINFRILQLGADVDGNRHSRGAVTLIYLTLDEQILENSSEWSFEAIDIVTSLINSHLEKVKVPIFSLQYWIISFKLNLQLGDDTWQIAVHGER